MLFSTKPATIPDAASALPGRSAAIPTASAAGSGGGRTAPAGAPRARIDYLLHAGEGLTPLAADVLPIRLSDHRAVRAAYALTDPRDPICFQKLG